ncbi:hypothetical protein TIFTF001_039456, partial [Ficus carica]
TGKGRIRFPGGSTRFSPPKNDGSVLFRAAAGGRSQPLVAARPFSLSLCL